MSAEHPDAVGSYAGQLMTWAETMPLHFKQTTGPRWWQSLTLARALEHDAEGRLVWPLVILSAPRQTGKSWIERMVCAWRMCQAERFGEPQTVLHVAHKLSAAREVWYPAALGFDRADLGSMRRANDQPNIEVWDGSRWIIQAANDGAGVGFSLSMALIDEAWRIPRRVMDDAIGPTIVESVSPQIWLVSTAGTNESDLMSVNRAAALAELDAPQLGSPLLLEWSAPPDPDLDIDDPAVWRAASPFWSQQREDTIRASRVRGDERAFRQQWLNQWVPSANEAALTEAIYARALTHEGLFGDIALAVEITTDRSSGVIAAAGGGVLEVIDERPGVGWIAPRLRELVARHDPRLVAFDSLGPAAGIGESVRAELGDKLAMLTGREVAAASGALYDRLTCEPPAVALRHSEGLHRAVVAAHQRRYGQTWTFARDVLGGVSGAPLAAVALALAASERPVTTVPLELPGVF